MNLQQEIDRLKVMNQQLPIAIQKLKDYISELSQAPAIVALPEEEQGS